MKQVYSNYTEEDFLVWKTLFERQMKQLKTVASKEYLDGIKTVGFTADRIPDFTELDKVLKANSGWSMEVVPNIIPQKQFFQLLAQKKFSATTWLRKMSQLDYLEEPDMFHDVFAHVPLLTNKNFSDFFVALGKLGVKHIDNDRVVEILGRIYWFTVEFGLIKDKSELKIYGAGILSSYGETRFCLGKEPQHLPFDVEVIADTSFQNDRIQDKYFVIESFEQLYMSIGKIDQLIQKESRISV